ncbi:MAG: riboflavin synthase, partial [Deltaproteobacteria bacterium]|nr:riboflavin synthase [Deltaproteobacteria bacterium]
MFTGLIQSLGDIVARRGTREEAHFTILPRRPLTNPEKGESIAVNGVCLTVESFSGNAFTAYASGETLSVSTLGDLAAGSAVNLERALVAGARLGGHLVSGHVDCAAAVTGITRRGASTIFRLAFPRAMGHLLIPKGSVALDGVSLTINECGMEHFTVNAIPETLSATTLHTWREGGRVNLETDVIGKYIARMVETGYGGGTAATPRPQGL